MRALIPLALIVLGLVIGWKATEFMLSDSEITIAVFDREWPGVK